MRTNLLKITSYFLVLNIPALAFADQNPWFTSINVGYGHYNEMFRQDGTYPLLRISFGKELISAANTHLGLELGAETGNTMRLTVPQNLLDQVGGMACKTIMKPPIDLLVTSRTLMNKNISILLKGGAALWTWQFDSCSSKDIIDVSPEVQVGLGYTINDNSFVQLLYGYTKGSAFNYFITAEKLEFIGTPNQHKLLLGITYLFGNS